MRHLRMLLFCCALIMPGLTLRAGAGGLENILGTLPPVIESGYAVTAGGGTIYYHSVNAHARSALLVRASDATQPIEWISDPAPAEVPEKGVTFVFLAAMSGSKGVHRFDMSVNGETLFHFTTAPDSLHKTFSETGPGGATLEFCATEADRFGDLFGYMFVVLPRKSLKPGNPLRFRVTGEAAGSDAWFMTFEHRLGEAAWVKPLPALVLTPRGEMQPVSVEVEHYGNPGTAKITMDGGENLTGRLVWGLSPFMVRSRPVETTTVRRVRVVSGKTVLADTSITMLPVRKRTLYLLPHSHTDIGYSDYQAVVEQHHMGYLDDGIDIAKRTAGYPEGSRYRWNVEVMWPLESYVSAATPEKRSRLTEAVKNGWVGLDGLYSNVLTGLCRPEELFHLTDYARKASALFGVPVKAAMISDIPAYSSSIVPALAHAGIRYLSSGPNYVPVFFDGGDRIGYALKAWGDRPFYWVSSSGQDTVLFWMAGRGYSWFHGLNMGELGSAQSSEVFDYVSELDARNYPYDMIEVRYTVGDNGPPDPRLPDVVRRWNTTYASPRFAIATTTELFEKFEGKYGHSLPVRRGDLTPYWEDGAASTARELAENRQTAEALLQTETLFALLHGAPYPPDAVYHAWRGVHLFDEHTWGAANSISDPDSPNVKDQWEYKLSFLKGAEDDERALRSAVAGPLPSGTVHALDIVNTNSWPRTGLVLIPKEIPLAGLRARDGAGGGVPAQRISTGETAILVKNVPPFGSLRVQFETGDPFPPSAAASVSGTMLRDGIIEARVDSASGVISMLTSGGGENLVDTEGGGGLNQYLYVPGRDPQKAQPDRNISVHVTDSGPLVAALSISSAPPGGTALTRTIRVTAGTGRLDITDVIVKSRIREKESVHFAFPFRLFGGKTRIDNAFDVIRPDSDQLAGSCKDYFCAEHWVDVSNDASGVLVATPDAPLIEPGTMTDETLNRGERRSWKEKTDAGTRFYSYVMNNYWHTNYKADQDGECTIRYAVMPHGKFDPAAAERAGIEVSQPLLPVAPQDALASGSSLLSVGPPSVIATALKPAANGKGWILHLYNAGGSDAGVRLRWNRNGGTTCYTSDLNEAKGEAIKFPLTLPPSGIAIVRIE